MLVRKSETRIQKRTGRGIDKRNRRVNVGHAKGRKEEREREGWNGRVVSKPLGTREKSERKTEGRQVKMEEGRGGWIVVKEERDGGMERTVY